MPLHRTPQVLVSLSPGGELAAELPGPNGTRRKVQVAKRAEPPSGPAKVNLVEFKRPDGTLDTEAMMGAIQSAYWAGYREGARESFEALIRRILSGQRAERYSIGEDGAPTAQQVRHWERHEMFPDERCPFCISEGRITGGAGSRPKPIVLSDYGGVVIRRLLPKASSKRAQISAKSSEDLGL